MNPEESYESYVPEEQVISDYIPRELTKEEKNSIPHGLYEDSSYMNFFGGFVIGIKSVCYFFNYNFFKIVKVEVIMLAVSLLVYFIFMFVFIIIESACAKTSGSRSTVVLSWVLVFLLLGVIALYYVFFFVIFNSLMTLSDVTEKIMCGENVQLQKTFKRFLPSKQWLIFTIPFGLLLIPEAFIYSIINILLILVVWIPIIGLLIFFWVNGIVIGYFGLKIIFLKRKRFFKLFEYYKTNFSTYAGMGVALSFILLIPYFGFLMVFFILPVSVTRTFLMVEFVERKSQKDKIHAIQNNQDSLYHM